MTQNETQIAMINSAIQRILRRSTRQQKLKSWHNIKFKNTNILLTVTLTCYWSLSEENYSWECSACDKINPWFSIVTPLRHFNLCLSTRQILFLSRYRSLDPPFCRAFSLNNRKRIWSFGVTYSTSTHTHRFPVSTFPVIRKDKERADCVTQDTMVNDVNQTTVSSNGVFLVCTSKLGINRKT